MLTLANASACLAMAENYATVTLEDRRRGVVWQLDSASVGYRLVPGEALRPLTGGCVTRDGGTLCATFRVPDGLISYRWSLIEDGVIVTLTVESDAIESVTLPGSFRADESSCELALPIYQGVLLHPEPGTWEHRAASGGHGAFSMAMGGMLTDRGGLLLIEDSLANWEGVYGLADGAFHFTFEQARCPVNGWETHRVHLACTDASVTALCKRYRAEMIARGQFVGWEEKIVRKPILRRLFGALMAFTGYNQMPGLDYAAQVRRLKDYGFDSILLYPVRMCHHSLDFQMGGDDPVWLSDDDITAIKAIDGALVAPWGWMFEALDDGTPARAAQYRRQSDGGRYVGWKIDDYQWYLLCTPAQRAAIRTRYAGDMAAMDWIHYDVNASFPPMPCFADHPDHGGHPLGKQEDVRQVQQLLGPETNGNRIVSSEGFVGHFTPYYDIGSTKMMPGPHLATRTPVPMTMLVYHDSCLHDWWELHNYNGLPGWQVGAEGHGFGLVGNGLPRLKAAQDALYGCPPNVFPFGRQYGWVNVATRETFSFTIGLDDPAVQEALAVALPVARLHKQTGPQEMTDFRLLTPDRGVQETTFADGTRVVANLTAEPMTVHDWGTLDGQSWRMSRR
jgi:hypothetical protein